MFCCTLLYVHSIIAIILMGKRELIALLNLSSWCLVMFEWHFLAVPRGCLQFVIVVFPDHTHLLLLALQFYGLFQGGTSFVDHLYLLCHVFLMLSHLFIAAFWSPTGKGLSLGSCRCFLLFFCYFPMLYPWSGVYLIVMFSDRCLLSYFVSLAEILKTITKKRQKNNTAKITKQYDQVMPHSIPQTKK